MKKVIFLAALAIILVSCENKEEKGAIEYLKSKLKSPSSFELVSCTSFKSEGGFVYDTVYHISAITGEYDDFSERYTNVSSVSYDSMKIYKRSEPANTIYLISYDADNSFGAKLRDNAYIYYYNGMYTEDLFSMYGEFELDKKEAITGTLPYTDEFGVFFNVGEWQKISGTDNRWFAYSEEELLKQ